MWCYILLEGRRKDVINNGQGNGKREKTTGNQEIIYANKSMLRIFNCSSMEEFQELTGNSFRGIVHPDFIITFSKSSVILFFFVARKSMWCYILLEGRRTFRQPKRAEFQSCRTVIPLKTGGCWNAYGNGKREKRIQNAESA